MAGGRDARPSIDADAEVQITTTLVPTLTRS
jgi:hypothetical protein